MSDSILWLQLHSSHLLTAAAVQCKISLGFAENEAENPVNAFFPLVNPISREIASLCEVGITQLETRICDIKPH